MPRDIVFPCPSCSQGLEAPADMAGLVVECPRCSEVVRVPASSATVPIASTGADDARKGATIRIDLPPNLGIPIAPSRRLVIRRRGAK